MSKRVRESVSKGLADVFDGADLLGSVIRGDRMRSGRAAEPSHGAEKPPEYDTVGIVHWDNMPSKDDIKHYDNMTSLQEDTQTHKQADTQADKQVSPQTPKQASGESKPELKGARRNAVRADREAMLQVRRREAHNHSQSPTTTVTLRLPQDLNHWIDGYVHRSWPTKVRKQELVIEALKLLYAMRGKPGESILETDLLGSGQTESSDDDGKEKR
jgi:hypothetical protein